MKLHILSRTVGVMVLSMVLSVGTAFAQSNEPAPLTPEQIAQIRELLADQALAEIPRPDEIEASRQLTLDQQQAANVTGYSNTTNRRAIKREVIIIGEGASTPYDPQNLSLWEGLPTSLSFFDHQGQAWPIDTISFDRRAVAVDNEGCDGGAQSRMEGQGNVMTVMPCQFWTNSYMHVLLRDETRPISFSLLSGSREEKPIVDGAVTVAVQSDVSRPYGQTRVGKIDNAWVVPNVRTMNIDPIDTQADAQVNRLSVMNGVTTDVSFMDSNKTPWPVAEIVYPPGLIAVNGPCEQQEAGLKSIENNESATFYLTACMNTRSTIGVRLKGRAGAISLMAVPAQNGQSQPDGTLSITIPGSSPITPRATLASAAAPGSPRSSSGYGIGFTSDRYLDDFLMATPPQGSRRANIRGGEGVGVEGWFFNGALYLRGSFVIVNPAHDAQGQSGDGTVYVWKYGPPVSRVLARDLAGREFAMNID